MRGGYTQDAGEGRQPPTIHEHDYAATTSVEDTRPLYERRAGLSAANRGQSTSRERDGGSPGATGSTRDETSTSSFILPGMSGIGLATYGSSPPVATTHMHAHASATAAFTTNAPAPTGSGFHFPRFGSSGSAGGTASSAGTGTGSGSASSHLRPLSSGGRYRNHSNTRERVSQSPKIGGDRDSDSGSSYPTRPASRPGTSSGTSANSTSSWNFFRSSASSQPAPRHRHADSFSSIRESPNEYLEAPTPDSSGANTPNHASRSGLTTPIAISNTGLNEAISKRKLDARLQQRSNLNRTASFTLLESALTAASPNLGSTHARRKGKRHNSPASGSVTPPALKRADNLCAMAGKSDNSYYSSLVAVAGRNLAKIIHVKQGNEDGAEREFAYDIVEETGFRVSLGKKRQEAEDYVKIEETLDLHSSLMNAGHKRIKTVLINDIGWGYDYTANKVVTGHSNGTVAIYDIEKSGSKFESLRTPHPSGRGINVVSFGGPSGQGAFIASGCQDGDIAIIDIRHANVITLSTPLDPIRSLCFAPRNSSAPSYHLVAAAESGHISRWDLRQPKVPIDRTIAHSGGALTLDWKASVSNYSAFAGESGLGDERRPAEDGWGWLATAGMDGTVKIWDMSASNGSMRQVHTLNVARPVSFVRWHASAERPCDVVVTPLSASSTPGQSEKSWQPDIEIWDVRREYLAKETLWTGGALVSCLSPPSDSSVLWALNRSTSAFQQIDVRHEAVDPLSYCPKVATAWSPEGTVAFAIGSSANLPTESAIAEQASPAEEAIPAAQTVGLVAGLDADFDLEIFEFLSQQYQHRVKPPLTVADICLANAQVAMEVQLFSVAKIWKLAADWIAREAALTAAQTPAPEPRSGKRLPSASKGQASPSRPSMQRTRSQTSPSVALQHLQHHRRTSQKSSPLVTSQTLGEGDVESKVSPRPQHARLPPVTRPGTTPRVVDNADLIGSDTSNSNSAQEDSTTSDASAEGDEDADVTSQADGDAASLASNPAMSLSALLTKKRPALAAVSRQNTIDAFSPSMTALQLSSELLEAPTPRASVPPTPAGRQMALPLGESSLGLGRPSASMSASLSMSRTNSSKTQTRFPSRKNSDDSSVSSSASEHARTKGSDSGHQTLEEQRRAKAKKKLQQRARGHHHSKSRSGGQGHYRRRVVSNNDAQLAAGRPPNSRSVSNSRGRSASKARMSQMRRKKESFQADANAMLHESTRQHLVQALAELADTGDVQTSATLACLLRDKLQLSQSFFARTTAAYLKMLRQLDCHVSSAGLVKHSELEDVRAESQESTTIRTACGNCEKGIHSAPFGKCQKCSLDAVYCSICHTVGTSLWIWCITCGHGAHESCLYLYAADMSIVPGPDGQDPLLDLDYFSRRSTPLQGMHTPIATAPSSPLWLFPAEQALFHATPVSGPQSRMQSRAVSPDPMAVEEIESRIILLSQCPSGCGHQCLLTLPLTELAAAAYEHA